MSVTGATTGEIVAQSQQLGITWGRRPGTVTVTTGSYTATVPAVMLDGDTAETAAIPVTSLCGPLAVGMRVMVDTVPSPTGPPAHYAAGIFSDEGPWSVSETTPTVVAITAETVVLTVTDVALRAGSAYRVRVGSGIAGPTDTVAVMALRWGSLAGPVISASPYYVTPGVVPIDAQWTAYIATGSTEESGDVVLTLTGTSTGHTHSASATMPRYVHITYAGAAADYPQAVAIP